MSETGARSESPLRGVELLVTGAGGCIGSATVRALAARGASVRALLGPPGSPAIPAPPGMRCAFADVEDRAAIESLAQGAAIAVHLAGHPSVARSFAAPSETARVHVGGTATVLEACRAAGVRRFVYVSSAEVYGAPERLPVDEEQPVRPRSPYGAAKLCGEGFVSSCASAGGFEAVLLRPFSVYGPGAAPTSVLGTIFDAAHRGAPVSLADLASVRDFTFVGDVARAIARACEAALPERVRVYNVASGAGTSVAELAQLALAAAGLDLPVQSGEAPPRRNDIAALVGDADRARRELGWRAEVSLADGLERTWQWWKQNGVRR